MDELQRKQVGARVREARRARGWAQARLAQEADVSENTILSIEQGKRETQAGKLRAVLDALELAAPVGGDLDLDGVPDDVRIFVKVAVKRLTAMDHAERAQLLAELYPRLLLMPDM